MQLGADPGHKGLRVDVRVPELPARHLGLALGVGEVGADPGRLRIGFSTVTPLGDPLDPECRTAVEHAAALTADDAHVGRGDTADDVRRSTVAWSSAWSPPVWICMISPPIR